jgi:four helix bundle protein
MKIQSFRDLEVWQKSMILVEQIYRLSARFPANEEYGLKAQMRRAAVSIPSNIAEGHSRRHSKEFLHHLSIALGSVAELQTQIELATRQHHIDQPDIDVPNTLCSDVCKMLHGLIKAIRRRSSNP